MKFSILILTFLINISLSLAWGADEIVFITNQNNSISKITKHELLEYFMKKDRTWPDGTAVRFFDHRDDNKSREIFLKKFVGKTSREIELYWIGEKIYTGHIAPIQITSDSMMVRMVARFPGGVGYVSKKYKLPKNIKRLEIAKE